TPADGFEGEAAITYSVVDADGDTDSATLTVTVDATPEIEVDPEEPNAEGNSQVDEAGLDDGGSQAATDLETTSGSLNIDTGSDSVGSLVLKDKDGNDVNVTNGGTVQGSYGVLTVSVSA
ncbi:Ig-like domain-containing protein, partial [Halomonas sp. V046]|uniref:Ig-like domain-containing protein n=1 Tax=Halomonas sp. V046 TaxID=3459611 RepID=UPI004043CDE3